MDKMKIEDLLSSEVFEHFRSHTESAEEREMLVAVAGKILGRELVYTCRNCYVDTLAELVRLYKSNRKLFDERMKEKRYQIARGICMPLGFGSNRMIVYQNCTEGLAIEFLALNEDNSKYFELLPSDWKEDVKTFLAKQSGMETPIEFKSAELDAISDMKKMLSGGSTKKAIKEHFMSFKMIGETAVTNRFVDTLIKEASVQFEKDKIGGDGKVLSDENHNSDLNIESEKIADPKSTGSDVVE